MKITPLDIRRKEFKRSVRGYSDEEVDIFLDEVADEFERLFQENMELHDRMSRMDEQIAGHAQLKDALEKTLVSAQLQAEELRANAHKEGELILRDAEMKARGIVSDSYGETQKTQQTLVQLKLLEEDFRFKFRSLLEGYLRLLNQAPLATAGAEAPVSPESAPEAAPSAKVEPAPVRVAGEEGPPSAMVRAPQPPVAPATPVTQIAPAVAATAAPAAAAPAPRPAAPVVIPPVQGGAPVLTQQGAGAAPSVAPSPSMPSSAPTPPPAPPVVPPVPPTRPAPPVTTSEPPTLPAQRPVEPPRAPLPPVDDDVPTQESAPSAADEPTPSPFKWPEAPPQGNADLTQETETAETAYGREMRTTARSDDEEPARRFFFGRQMDSADDTFPAEDAGKSERSREFEW